MNALIELEFGYYPLIWMFHNRDVNKKIIIYISKLLQIVYIDNIGSFEDLLNRDKSYTIHRMNVKANLSRNEMFDIFHTSRFN